MPSEQPAVPYRAQSIPQITLTCVACARAYQADVGTPPGRCGPCHLAFVAANQAESARLYAASQRGTQRERRNAKLDAIMVAIVVGVVFGAYRLVTHKAYTEDMRAVHGLDTRPDERDSRFLGATETFATTMCACADLACASATARNFDRWTETAEPPKSDVIRDLVATQLEHATACHDKLRTH